jgi:hypothetical protein
VEGNKAKESFQETEAQHKVLLRDTKRRFIKALIVDSVYTIIWTIIGLFIPDGNWLAAYNIILAFLSFWIFCSFYEPFYRARVLRGWLSYLMAGITWFVLTLIVIKLVNLVANI